jgi:signal transduction histidine kinase
MPDSSVERELLRTDARVLKIIAAVLFLRHLAFIGNDLIFAAASADGRAAMAIMRTLALPVFVWMWVIAHRAPDRRALEAQLTIAVGLALVFGSLWRALEPLGFMPYFDAVTVLAAYVILPLRPRQLAVSLVPFSGFVVLVLSVWARGLAGWNVVAYAATMATVNVLGFVLAGYRWNMVRNLRRARIAQHDLLESLQQEVHERERAQAALEDERNNLERLVQARTADLEAANRALIDAVRTKDAFLATMSHELRTPLASILGLTEHLRADPDHRYTAEDHEDLATIESSGRHLLALIDDVLTLARAQGGLHRVSRTTVDLDALGPAVLRVLAPIAEQHRVRLTLTGPGTGRTIHSDERMLVQILTNLLSNAVKFTPAGGAVHLTIAIADGGASVRFEVEDTGIGIGADDLPRVVQPFEQVDQRFSRTRGGTGLGLAIVTRLVEALGGRLEIASTPGLGSRFTVVLPVAAADAAGTPRAPATR